MSKIIVRRQEYANNGTHANEIEEVVKQNLIANTLSSATDIAASVGLVKSETDAVKESLSTIPVVHSGGLNYSSYALADAIRQASVNLSDGMYWGNFVVSGASYEMMAKRYSWGIAGFLLPYGGGTAYRFYCPNNGTPSLVQF